jgi:UPF0755 protein
LPLNNISSSKKYIEIKPNSSVISIGKKLKASHIIFSELPFIVYAKFGPAHGQLTPGYYEFTKAESIAQIVDDLHFGKTSIVKITFPEGLNNKQVAAKFASSGMGSEQEFLKSLKENYDYDFLKNNSSKSLEGFLFPDTYIENKNSSAHDLIGDMLKNFQKKIDPYKEAISSNPEKFSLEQIVTLASLVEAEAVSKQDRQLVAGVFINRLKQNMKLQSDITLNYVTGHKITQPEDTKIDSAYNTYKNNGLPPTPVNNPSLESIEAVLFYTPSDYLFFIADKNGKVHYAKTLEEHNQNIAQYLK